MRRISLLLSLLFLASLTIAGQLQVKTSKKVYNPNEQITVTFSGFPGSDKDWITVIEKSKADDRYGEYFYTKRQKEGSFKFRGLPRGVYEVRCFYNWPKGEYKVQKRVEFIVKGEDEPDPVVKQSEQTDKDKKTAKKKIVKFPQGTIFFTKKGANKNIDLFSMNQDAKDKTQLTKFASWIQCVSIDYSVKEKKVLFLYRKKMSNGLGIVDVATKKVKILIEPGFNAEVKDAVWSPDGKKMAYILGAMFKNDIYIKSGRGKGKKITKIAGNKKSLAWSPKGKKILFNLFPPKKDKGGGTSYNHSQLCVVNTKGGGEKVLTKDPGNSKNGRWSPDAKKIAYVYSGIKAKHKNITEMANPAIWIMKSDGSKKKKISESKAWDYQPAWSPDGKKIAFISSRSNGYANVFVMNNDGSNVKQLTEQVYTTKSTPLLRNEGKFIFYMTEKSYQRNGYVVCVETKESRQLVYNCQEFSFVEKSSKKSKKTTKRKRK